MYYAKNDLRFAGKKPFKTLKILCESADALLAREKRFNN